MELSDLFHWWTLLERLQIRDLAIVQMVRVILREEYSELKQVQFQRGNFLLYVLEGKVIHVGQVAKINDLGLPLVRHPFGADLLHWWLPWEGPSDPETTVADRFGWVIDVVEISGDLKVMDPIQSV